MSDSQKRYSLDDELKRGYPEKPILKEEQHKILEKLLDVDGNRLSPEEQLLMQKLLGQLESDSRRVKEIRKRIEGRGTLSDLISLLQQDTESFRKPPAGEQRKPEAKPASPASAESAPAGEREVPPRAPKKAAPLSREPVVRPRASPPRTVKPKPWKEIVTRPQGEARAEALPRTTRRDQPTTAMSPEKRVPRAAPEPSPAASEARPSSQAAGPAASPGAKPEYSPVEVISRYIRAWNQKAFASEYECFSPSLIPMSKEAYVDRRMATYLSYNRDGQFQQQLGTVLKTHIDGDTAEILCTRSVREFHKLNYYLDLYLLRLEQGGWRITGVKTAIARQSGLPRMPHARPGAAGSTAPEESA